MRTNKAQENVTARPQRGPLNDGNKRSQQQFTDGTGVTLTRTHSPMGQPNDLCINVPTQTQTPIIEKKKQNRSRGGSSILGSVWAWQAARHQRRKHTHRSFSVKTCES